MSKTKKQIFARYFSPGTLFSEVSDRPLETGTVEEAVAGAKKIVERYSARPYGFDLITMIVAEPIDDGHGGTMEVQPKQVARKGRFFLGGKLIRYEEAVKREGSGSIMCSNMHCNNDPIAIEILNGYRNTQIFNEEDVIVDPETGAVLRRGDEPELVKYRADKIAEWKEELEEWMRKRAEKAEQAK